MTPAEVTKRAGELGFARLDALGELIRVAGAFTAGGARGRTNDARSYLGGLPRGIEQPAWPRKDGESLAFIAQIELGELPEALHGEGLPSRGSLLFFYDREQRTWGFDPADAGSAVVMLVNPDQGNVSPFVTWPPDLPEHARYKQVPVKFSSKATLPPWESVVVDELALSEEQRAIYMDLCDALTGDDAWSSRGLVGGYPDQIQGDMSLECALVSAGLYCGDAKAYQDPRLPQLRRSALDWRLLLQVPSAEEAGMMWGDGGCLYFWMRDQDMRAANFAASWMILQCG